MSVSRTDNIARLYRTTIPNNSPASLVLLDGELAVEQADPMRLWVGVPTTLDPTGRRLLYDSTGAGGGLTDAPVDGKAYGRQNEAWMQVIRHDNDIVDGGNF